MNRALFSLILLNVIFSQVLGPVEIPISSVSQNIVITPDQKLLIATFKIEDLVRVYENDGSGFQLKQTIWINNPFNLAVNSDGSLIAISSNNKLYLYESGEDGFQLLQYETLPSLVTCVEISHKSNFVALGTNQGEIQIYKRNQNSYEFLRGYLAPATQQEAISMSKDEKLLMIGDYLGYARIFQWENQTFNDIQTLNFPYKIKSGKITPSRLALSGYSPNIEFFTFNESQFEHDFFYDTEDSLLERIGLSADFSVLVYGGANQRVNVAQKNKNGSYDIIFSEQINTTITTANTDEQGLYYILTSDDNIMRIYYQCPVGCGDCCFPNNCSSCLEGYKLDQGLCYKIGYCVNNKYAKGKICKEYCDRKCKTCYKTKWDCIECAEFYTMNQKGECVIENNILSVWVDIRPFLNLVRKRGISWIFLVVDDLWLYQYHKQDYDGIVKVVFKTISFVEERQWEIVGMKGFLDRVDEQIEDIPEYNPYSNEKFMYESRRNNFMIDSLLDYFILFIPMTVIMVVIFNRLFYLLFNYRISKWLRSYSFWLILLELLIQNNIEYFTFLGIRTVQTMFSFNFTCKFLNGFFIIFLFLVFACMSTSYLFYFHRYGKLARYFLSNLFRFPSSYVLMIFNFGLKPFLKGLIHSIFYDYWVLQLYLLSGVEVAITVLVVSWELILERHKSRMILIFEVFYSLCLVALNCLILCKHEYFKNDKKLTQDLEIMLRLVVYMMIATLILRLLAYIKVQWLDCDCKSSSSVVPQNSKLKELLQSSKKKKKKKGKEGEMKEEIVSENIEGDGWRYFERNGERFIDFDFGQEKIIRIQLDNDEQDQDRKNQVHNFYLRRWEEDMQRKKQEERKKKEEEEMKKNKKKNGKKRKSKRQRELRRKN